MIRPLLAFALLSGSALAATWDQLPFPVGMNGPDRKKVEQGIGKSHPWQPGDALPVSFKDAGLELPVKLVTCALYLDGGSRCYIFQGANEKFLMMCTDSSISYSAETKKVTKVEKPQLYLAASHFTAKQGVAVPPDSATEQFLLGALKREAERINASRK